MRGPSRFSSRSIFAVAIPAVAACLLGFFLDRGQFFKSYLFAYLFWFQISIGCLGILLLNHLIGGAWGEYVRPVLETGSGLLPWMGALFIPLLFGLPVLYPWMSPESLADPVLRHKHLYLNGPFFCLRAAAYFVFWSFTARKLIHGSASSASRRFSAPGLLAYVFTVSLCSVDWMMSLEPRWSSTIYGVMVMVGAGLSALAFSASAPLWLGKLEGDGPEPSLKPVHDLGNMLFAFILFWAYMAFSQYIVIWSGNLPEETVWYVARQQEGWFWIAMILILCQFFLPFFVLLVRANKQKRGRLAWVAVFVLAVRAVDLYWLTQPPLQAGGLHPHWLDLATFIAVGSIWTGGFLKQWEGRRGRMGRAL